MKPAITPRKFLLITFTVWLIGFSFLPLFNYLVDIARVFHNDQKFYAAPTVREENKRVSRMRYLYKHRKQYNNYVVGSSRVWGGIAVADMGPGWHKLNYPGGALDEHLHNVQLLKKWNMLPQQLLLSVEEISLYSKGDHSGDYFRRLLPSSEADWLDFYKFYLFRIPGSADFRFFTEGKLQDASWLTMRGAYGVNRHPENVLLLSPYQAQYAHSQTQLPWIMPEIAAIRALCPTFIFITPRHYKTLALRDFDDLYRFNYLLAQQGRFWDFRPLSSPLMTNNHAWKETSHFNHMLGQALINKWKGGAGNVGVEIDQKNITREFAKMVSGLQKQLPALLLKDKMMRIHPTLLAGKPAYRMSSAKQILNAAQIVTGKNKSSFSFQAKSNPVIVLPAIKWRHNSPLFLKVKIEVPAPTGCSVTIGGKVVYKRNLETFASMRKLRNGPFAPLAFAYIPEAVQEFYIPILPGQLPALRKGNLIRLHLGRVPGVYRLKEVSVWPLRNWVAPKMDLNMVDFCLSQDSVFSAGEHFQKEVWDAVKEAGILLKVHIPGLLRR